MPGTPTPRYSLDTMNGAVDAGSTIDGTHNAAMAKIDAAMVGYSAGLLAARPVSTPGSPGITGRRYRATDTGQEFIDTGTSWIEIATSPVATAQIADAAVTSRKFKPTFAVASGNPAQAGTGAAVDVTGAVANLTPAVVSNVLVIAHVQWNALNATASLYLRMDTTDVPTAERMTGLGGADTNPKGYAATLFGMFTGVSAAAHAFKIRFNGQANTTVNEFNLMAIAFAQ